MSVMLLTISLIFNIVDAKSSYMPLPEVKINVSNDAHLTNEHVKLRCLNKDKICKLGGEDVCALRIARGERQLAHFENSCYLFMDNMCDHPGEEFHILSSGSCEYYRNTRRGSPKNATKVTTKFNTAATKMDVKTLTSTGKKPIARASTMSTLYEVDSAFDFHPCPFSCPDIYQPVCVSVNRGFGAYFKFFTFVNHCAGDLYYCKHWQEFSPPPDEDENVASSQLGWSYCGSSRYLQFARFAEVASSMGHYGWLAGDYKLASEQTFHLKLSDPVAHGHTTSGEFRVRYQPWKLDKTDTATSWNRIRG